jgi:Hexapeptide repeat of succinyl-transferase
MLNFLTFWITHLFKIVFYEMTSAITVVKMKLWGIEFKLGNKFNGVPILKCKPGSTIKIGTGNVFNSTQRSNLIGINRRCIIATHKRAAVISIGNNCGFSGTTLGAFEKIEIGDNVICGGNTLITDSDWHGIYPEKRDTSHAASGKVVIHKNVWLGVNAVILKGVTIGENSVIAANSVVTKDIPANVIAGGNPCKVIKELM